MTDYNELISFINFCKTLERMGLTNAEFRVTTKAIYNYSAGRYTDELREFECTKQKV